MRARPTHWRRTTRGLPSAAQTQADNKRQVEGNFAGHKDKRGHKQKTDKERPDIIAAKQTVPEKFMKFNVIDTVPRAP